MYYIDYLSRAEQPFSTTELSELMLKAQSFNFDAGITGFLYYDSEHFYQYLEGEYDALVYLQKKLEADPRHSILCLNREVKNDRRLFADWSMRRITRHSLSTLNLEQDIINMMLESTTYRRKEFWLDNVQSMVNQISELRYELD